MRKEKQTNSGLLEIIRRKDKEIDDIKPSMASILLTIRDLNESNDYSDPSARKRKISEICTDTRYQLLMDENQDGKIIELTKINCFH